MTGMSLKKQFKILIEFFNREDFDYAVIGAFALHAYGYTRATRDVDFITRFEYQDKIVGYLESLGFETLNRSEGYSNHLHSVGAVRIDLVYVSDKTADIVFESTKKMAIFEDFELPVVSPEHLVALKLFAVHNDPSRKYRELADIKEILQLTDVDNDTIREYFRKYDLEEYYDEIARQ
jgi:predicted nucleotidyltransferase